VTAEAIVINGRAEQMGELGDARVDLVITSPPFFDSATEAILRQPRSHQKDFATVEKRILSYADTMFGAFGEIARVISKKGTFILHTKDIRFGDALVPLAAHHEDLARASGLRTVTRIYWRPSDRPARSGRSFNRLPLVGAFRATEVETFAVFRVAEAPVRRTALIEGMNGEPWLTEPLWVTSSEISWPRHRHASPPEVMRRLIALFTVPGDVVLDPFCGGGGLLEIAVEMGRSAIGFEADPHYAQMARSRLRRFQ
jgi:DNA modification methylase